MKRLIVTLLLLSSLFVAVEPGRAWACEDNCAGGTSKMKHAATEKSCCHKTGEAQPAHADHDSGGKQQQSGSSCPCDHENGGCHCPGCGMVCHSVSGFVLDWIPLLPFSFLGASLQKQAFYFADHLPEAVYLPIWQPPKLGV